MVLLSMVLQNRLDLQQAILEKEHDIGLGRSKSRVMHQLMALAHWKRRLSLL